MKNDDQPSDTGRCSGSAFGRTFEESPPLPFPQRRRAPEYSHHDSYASEHYRRYSENERLGVRPVNNSGTYAAAATDDRWSSAIVSITFTVFVSIAVIFGVYASENLQLGPNSSILIKPNHLLVNSIEVVEIDAAKGSMVYGFYEQPTLDSAVNWSETRNIILPGSTHKEWIYHLNAGSQINVTYSVNTPSSESLVLVIARGKNSIAKWLEDPSDPSTSFSWNIIRGNGSIQVDLSTSDAYYIGVGNLKSKVVEVQLDTEIKASLYNIKQPYYRCNPSEGQCSFELSFLGGNSAILNTPGKKSGNADGYWNIKLSYGPRWTTYLVSVGGIAAFVLFVTRILNPFQSTSQERRDQPGDMGAERNPLLSHEDNDLSTRGSIYAPSAPKEEEHVEDALSGGVIHEGEPVTYEENSKKSECAICFDAHRDCFFIPCGHCVACFGCATSIAETSGACPVCRQGIKEVKKIYTV